MKHIYNGDCPDDVDPKARDKDCPLCKLLIKNDKANETNTTRPTPTQSRHTAN